MALHFAYGSNMSRAAMRGRCPDAVALGTGRLAGWRFVLTPDGYASVEAWPGALVHGVLWRISTRDLVALNVYEAVERGLYVQRQLPILHEGGRRQALVYVAARWGLGRSPPGYLEGVITAARDWRLPESYIDSLRGCCAARRNRARPTEEVG